MADASDAQDIVETIKLNSNAQLTALGEIKNILKSGLGVQSSQTGGGALTRAISSPAFLATLTGVLSYNALKGVAGAAGGMSSVDKSMGMVGGTIAQVLMPGFVALGAAALAVSDEIQGWIDANLDDIVDTWASAISDATEAVEHFKDILEGKYRGDSLIGQNLSNTVLMFKDPAAAFDKFLGDAFGAPLGGGDGGDTDKFGGNRKTIVGGDFGKDSFGKTFANNMRMIAQDMRASTGTASIGTAEGKWREVMQAIMKSPLEQKQDMQREKMIRLVEDIAKNIEERANNQAGAIVGGRARRP